MNKNSKDTGSIYLPERYKQQIEAKKRRRLIKKIVVICTVVALCSVLYLILSGALSNSLNQPPLLLPGSIVSAPEISPTSPPGELTTTLTPNMTAVRNNDIIIGQGILDQPTHDMQSLDNATASLRQDYPAPEYTLISVNVTDLYADRTLYEFTIKQENISQDSTGFSVFIDARTGDLYTPGQESAKITADKAENIVTETFPLLHPDRVRVRYNNSPDSVHAWVFTMFRDNTTILTGTMDPETGQIFSFARSIPWEGRQADPLLEINAAQKIADRYIFDKNRAQLPLNMSEARYNPLRFPQKTVAGHYVFIYNRIVQEIPCDKDGFTISVDSLTGEVIGYDRRWNSPDSAFSVTVDPLVTRSGATFAVLKKAQETYPASGDGLSIISAEIRWKDHPSQGSIPRPGSIPLAWKVLFTDEIIRTKQPPVPAIGWVDAQTGAILDINYQH
ncbi:MAG: hypothetical protein MUO95_06880 [Methanoregula sp.]|nr:hypothetical protein [Methanoregula sp.]